MTFRLGQRQIFCARLASHLVSFDLKRDLLAFGKAGKSSPFDGADVNEDVVSAIVGLDKPEPLLAIEPLYSTCRHSLLQRASRVTITRFKIQLDDVFGKEPAGAFKKAQRLIE